MKALAFSDLHLDREKAERLVEKAAEADLVLGAGDYAEEQQGLEEAVGWLREIEAPTVLVPGNNETEETLNAACAGWGQAQVLHGRGTRVEDVAIFGLGGGIPATDRGWSFDLTDAEATELLEEMRAGAVLISHAPPRGACGQGPEGEEGSVAVREAIERVIPRLVVCGHVHESWGARASIGPTEVANVGPEGAFFEL
ncbi:MAG: metallophosphoesterase family protein [Solirubrobacterales bacterium]